MAHRRCTQRCRSSVQPRQRVLADSPEHKAAPDYLIPADDLSDEELASQVAQAAAQLGA